MKIFIYFALVGLTLAEPPSYRQQYQRDRQTYYVAKQLDRQSEAEEADSPLDAPYPPSGWKPDGPEFGLPQKQQQQSPEQQYGAPDKVDDQYGAPVKTPQRQYVVPVSRPRQFIVSQPQSQVSQQQFGPPQPQYYVQQQQQQQNFVPRQNYGVPEDKYGAPLITTTDLSAVTDYEDSTTLSPTTESQAESVGGVNELDDIGDLKNQQKQSGEYFIALPDGRLQRVQYISSQNLEAMKYFAKIRAENVEPLRGPIYAYQPLQKLQFAPAQLQIQTIDQPIVPTIVSEVREDNFKNQKIIQTSMVSAASDTSSSSSPSSSSSSSSSSSITSQSTASGKLQIQPLAAEAPGAPLSTSYTTYMANYQVPAAEQRYFITF